MKIREFVEECMIKVLTVKAEATGSKKKAEPFIKEIERIRLIGLNVLGDLNLMDVDIKTREIKFNRFTGEQYVVFNDSVVYSITDNKIYRVQGGFGTFSEFTKKFSRKVKVRAY